MIAAPRATVFPWLAESEARCRWMGAIVESEPLTDGPPEPVLLRPAKLGTPMWELGEVDPQRVLVVQLVSDVFEATIDQRLEQADGGTRLTAEIETTYTKLAARLLASVVTRHAQKRLEADLARLKDLVESDAV